MTALLAILAALVVLANVAGGLVGFGATVAAWAVLAIALYEHHHQQEEK